MLGRVVKHRSFFYVVLVLRSSGILHMRGTMILSRSFPVAPVAWFGAFLLSIYAAAILILHSQLFAQNPELGAFAITLDLTLSVPLLYYLLVIRRTPVPPITLLPVVTLSLLGAFLLLPPKHQNYLSVTKYGFLAAATFMALRGMGRGVNLYREAPQAE